MRAKDNLRENAANGKKHRQPAPGSRSRNVHKTRVVTGAGTLNW
jgi:hypothetical protein